MVVHTLTPSTPRVGCRVSELNTQDRTGTGPPQDLCECESYFMWPVHAVARWTMLLVDVASHDLRAGRSPRVFNAVRPVRTPKTGRGLRARVRAEQLNRLNALETEVRSQVEWD